MDEYIIGVFKESTGRVLFWEGVLNKQELAARITLGTLPEGFKIYRLNEVLYTTEKKTKFVEVDEISIEVIGKV
jgi:hypothetical protein